MLACIHKHKHTHTLTCAYIPTCSLRHTNAHTLKRTHARMHAHTHTHTHSPLYMNLHINTQTPSLAPFLSSASCHVLYGERIGLFSSKPSRESEQFIWAVEKMLATTPPLLYLSPRLLHHLRAPLWTQHATAWDHIFSHGDTARLNTSMATPQHNSANNCTLLLSQCISYGTRNIYLHCEILLDNRGKYIYFPTKYLLEMEINRWMEMDR